MGHLGGAASAWLLKENTRNGNRVGHFELVSTNTSMFSWYVLDINF